MRVISIQHDDGKPIPDIRQNCIEHNRGLFPQLELIRFPGTKDAAINQSDVMRYEMAVNNPDMLYIDTDCFIKGLPEFIPGKPYFGFWEDNRPDGFLFYVNNCIQFFRDFWVIKERYNIKTKFCWPKKILKNADVHRIPGDCYIHLNCAYAGLTT